MSASTSPRPIKTVFFVDDSSDEFFLADFSFKRQGIVADLTHFVDFASFESHLDHTDASDLQSSIGIIDLNLTISKGSDGIAHLRSDHRYRDFVLGVCSGSDDPADRQMAIDAGADFFVTKPLNETALIAICEQVSSLHHRVGDDETVSIVRSGTVQQ